MEILQRINRFYFLLMAMMVVFAVVAIIVLRGVFGAISLAGELDESLSSSTTPRLEKEKINDALNSVNGREFTPLDL